MENKGLPLWLSGRESVCTGRDAGATGLIPESGRSPEEGNANPPRHSCPGNPKDEGAWRAIVCGVVESWT